MTDDSSRAEQYSSIRSRFLSDPQFRDQLAKDPAGTLESILGPLSDEERSRLTSLTQSVASPDELLGLVSQNPPPVGIW